MLIIAALCAAMISLDLCPDGLRILRMLPADGPPNDWRRPLACMGAQSALPVWKGSRRVLINHSSSEPASLHIALK